MKAGAGKKKKLLKCVSVWCVPALLKSHPIKKILLLNKIGNRA